MVKKACGFDQKKTCLRKGKWSPEEDQKLMAYINRYGIWIWTQMPKAAGLLRSGKSCRLRWMNYLKPGIMRGNFSGEEDLTIIRLHRQLGNKWSTIAARLPGRTDNEIKNHWHTTLKKGLKNNKEEPTTNSSSTVEAYDHSNPHQVYDLSLPNSSKQSNLDCCNINIATTSMSSQLSTDTFSSSPSSDPASENYKSQISTEENYNGSSETFGEFQSFWGHTCPVEGLYMEDDYYGTAYTDPGFMVPNSQGEFQENTYTSASYYCDDHGNDLCVFGPIF